MVKVELSIQAKSGKWMTKEIVCVRPNLGEDILCDDEEFEVHAIAVQSGEDKVLARVVHSSGKKLSARLLSGMGFFPVEND